MFWGGNVCRRKRFGGETSVFPALDASTIPLGYRGGGIAIMKSTIDSLAIFIGLYTMDNYRDSKFGCNSQPYN